MIQTGSLVRNLTGNHIGIGRVISLYRNGRIDVWWQGLGMVPTMLNNVVLVEASK